jgi:hypothetical protein
MPASSFVELDPAVRGTGHVSVVEIVLRTQTPEGITVVLTALVYAKILEEHAAVADLALIDRTIRRPDQRRRDSRPGRERFFRLESRLWVMAVVEYGEPSAIVVTVFSAERPPSWCRPPPFTCPLPIFS